MKLRCEKVGQYLYRETADREAAALRAQGFKTRVRSKRAAIAVLRSRQPHARGVAQEDIPRVYVLYRCKE